MARIIMILMLSSAGLIVAATENATEEFLDSVHQSFSARDPETLTTRLIIIGAIVLFRRKPTFALLVGWFTVQYLYLAGSPIENIRFALAIFLPRIGLFLIPYFSTSMPIERAVPPIIFIAASISFALRSGILI